MGYVLADSGLAPWGNVAAIILVCYLFVSALLGLATTAVLALTLVWIRKKAELLKRVRPKIDLVNTALENAQQGEALPPEMAENHLMQAVSQVPRIAATLPAKASAIERQVEQKSDRVAHAVIELRARSAMVKGMAKALFLPGLTSPRTAPSVYIRQTESRAEEVEEREKEPIEEHMEHETPPYEEMTMVQRMR